MSIKKNKYASTNNKKTQYARDIITLGDIKVPDVDIERALKDPGNYLEEEGWTLDSIKDYWQYKLWERL